MNQSIDTSPRPSFLDKLTGFFDAGNRLLPRLMISLLFLVAAIVKLFNSAGTAAYMDSVGVSGSLVYVVIAFELVVFFSVAFNKFIRPVSYLAALFCLVSAALFHNEFTNSTHLYMALKNVSIAGGFLLLASAFSHE
ncbi:DoxX family protein [Marinobacterium aestuariivivens]|uniref:DoxX family protein n=1 Tax=Marinobacterium aestuariivivens TaxID=1698799 RepID=A0ABW2A009_9GAMM